MRTRLRNQLVTSAAIGLLMAALPSEAHATWTLMPLGTDNLDISDGQWSSPGNYADFVLKNSGQVKACVTPNNCALAGSWINVGPVKSDLVSILSDANSDQCGDGPYLYGISNTGRVYRLGAGLTCLYPRNVWNDVTPSVPSCQTSIAPNYSAGAGMWSRGCDGNIYRAGVNMNFQADAWGANADQVTGTIQTGVFVMDQFGWLYKFNVGTGHFDWLANGPSGWPRSRYIRASKWVQNGGTVHGVQAMPNDWAVWEHYQWNEASWSWQVSGWPPYQNDQWSMSGWLLRDTQGHIYKGW